MVVGIRILGNQYNHSAVRCTSETSPILSILYPMKICDPKYTDLILDVIRHALGTAPLHVIPIPTVPDSLVYEVILPTGAVVFKAIDPAGHDPDGIGLEAPSLLSCCNIVIVLQSSRLEPCLLDNDSAVSRRTASCHDCAVRDAHRVPGADRS